MCADISNSCWKDLTEQNGGAECHGDRRDGFSASPGESRPLFNRRDFLKLAGFAFTGAAACGRAPVEKAIPYLVQPEAVVPGRSYFYASTCGGCSAGCGVLVKNRDGRPIKIEGNPDHPVSGGGLCAVGQASLLGLYDSHRLRYPIQGGKKATWETVDREIGARLEGVRRRGGAVRFLTGTLTSPTARWMVGRFLDGFSNARHVAYDALSCSAVLDAHRDTHGVRVLPRFRFDRAEVIVGFDADFLGTWISPVEFTGGYTAGRRPEQASLRFSYHVQFESRLSLTGSKADRRVCIAPWEVGAAVAHLADRLARKAGVAAGGWDAGASPVAGELLDDLAERLWQHRGKGLVLCGGQDVPTQVLCNLMNHLLGNYGSTLDVAYPSCQRQGDDRELEALHREVEEGEVSALFVWGANPVYDLPGGERLAEALAAVPLSVSFAQREDETAAAMRYVCPDRHPLEAWGDAEPVSGVVGLFQPAIQPLGHTRPVLESLSAWMGEPLSALDILQAYWEKNVFTRQTKARSFRVFWERSVHDGFARVAPEPIRAKAFNMAAVRRVAGGQRPGEGQFAVVVYPEVGMLDGRHAHNPWLQELPDPITKVTWDNDACFSPGAASALGLKEGDVVRIEAGAGRRVELPVYIQPGQHDRVIAVALGYGGRATERFAGIGPRWLEAGPTVGEDGRVGKNAAPLLSFRDGTLRYTVNRARVVKTGKRHDLACTQTYDSLNIPAHLAPRGGEIRPFIQETTLAAFLKDPSSGAHPYPEPEGDLWPEDHAYTGHHWGMAIDLSACTGCSACVTACQVENNIPVVGRDEVRRQREMHWMRIDRYYADTDGGVDTAYLPMMCQQCDNAPCETVCPVLATVHSKEGLNEQIYNRCIGTRYCANNCPYKVRRFNWFDYPREDRLQNMALNPDVTVRSRGIMEKCTFCVQRIQEARIEARRRGQSIVDGAIQPACQQACPAKAIVFGDMNDPESRVSQMMKGPRIYRVLVELNVRPSVGYLRLVRNRPESERKQRRG